MEARDLGMDSERLDRISRTVAADVAAERYDGGVVPVARHGEIAFHEAIGFAERASERRARVDDVLRGSGARPHLRVPDDGNPRGLAPLRAHGPTLRPGTGSDRGLMASLEDTPWPG